MQQKKSEEKILTVSELAARWKISKSHIYNAISNKTFQLKPMRVGRLVRFRLEDVEKFERR